MLKLSSRCVGAAFFGVVAALVSGFCFGIRAWWPAGICLAATFACLCWCGRGAMFIDEVLTGFGVPLEGVFNTRGLLDCMERIDIPPKSVGVKPPKPWPRPPEGWGRKRRRKSPKDRQIN